MNSPAGFVLRLPVLTPAVLITAFTLGGIVVALLLARRVPRWAVLAITASAAGAMAGGLALWIVEKPVDLFGTPLGWSTRWWVVACFAALGLATANLHRSTLRRKAAALASAMIILATTGLGINAGYGLNPTLGSLFGVATVGTLALPTPVVTPNATSTATEAPLPLWQAWTAPAGMPTKGTVGTEVIPNTASHFVARPAGVYLPPAALTANPPQLPLVVLMMGQPGNPDPQYIAAVLDKYAADHQGLAPIVVVADQLGDPTVDTLCLDTAKFGNVETYINTDVVEWARTHLNILATRDAWTIAGYSHGGQCAISFAAKHPDLWGNVLDISGEEYPGAEHAATTLADVFAGNQAAYDAQKPVTILSRHSYPDTTAIFTVSTDDPAFMPGVKRVSAAAQAAGMHVTYGEVLNGGHVIGALNGGLDQGFAVLYPRLALSPP
ncbi:MAG: alpha/beta hydrolase [Cellulomonas sp.]